MPLADALARRFQQRFAGLIELDDARQVARYELIRAAACVRPGCCTTAAFLKRRIHGALQHYLRDHGRLVRVSLREHVKGLHPWGHQSLVAAGLREAVALGPDDRPYLDNLASPESEEPASEDLGVSIEALLQRLAANEAAILRLRLLVGQSLRSVAGELGISVMSSCDCRADQTFQPPQETCGTLGTPFRPPWRIAPRTGSPKPAPTCSRPI